MPRLKGRQLSREKMEGFFSKGELQILDKMEEMFRIHENTAYAGIVGCAIQFYRYNPAIERSRRVRFNNLLEEQN